MRDPYTTEVLPEDDGSFPDEDPQEGEDFPPSGLFTEDLSCMFCRGPCEVLGTLANRHWMRCRHCGMDQSFTLSTEG